MVNQEDTSLGTLEIKSESCVRGVAIGPYVPSEAAHADGGLQDLKTYFERPRLIARGNLVDTRSSLWSFEPTLNTIFNTWFPEGSKRLMGIYGLRFSLKFTVILNHTPFHQGVLAMCFQPHNYGSNSTDRAGNACTVTNLPHVRVDISEATMLEFKVPWVSEYEYLDDSDSSVVYGKIALWQLMPCVFFGNLPFARYDIMVSLEDMEFFGVSPAATTDVEFQGATTAVSKSIHGPVARTLLKENQPTGRMSGAMHMVGEALISAGESAGYFVPQIAPAISATGWALGVGARIASWFGWSRPVPKDPPVRMLLQPNAMEHNVDVPSSSIVVGPMASNMLSVDASLAFSTVDEMAFDYIKQQWSQINFFRYTDTLGHGAYLWGAKVGPASCWYREPLALPAAQLGLPYQRIGKAGFMPSSLCYLAQTFRYWRGGIKYRFTFCKTMYHGGRVMVTFVPRTPLTMTIVGGINPDPNPFSYMDGTVVDGQILKGPETSAGLLQPFGHTKIFDLRDASVFEFEVPFVCPKPYCSFGEYIGDLTMVVLEPLVANTATTPLSVSVMVEVCGSESFEVAGLASPIYPPWPARSLEILQGAEPTDDSTPDAALVAMGEKLMSVKQLIAIPGRAPVTISGTQTFLTPWVNLPEPSDPVPITAASPNIASFWQGPYWAACYAFWRGSSEYHVYCKDGNGCLAVHMTPNIGRGPSGTGVEGGCCGGQPAVDINQGLLHVRTPPYAFTARRHTNLYNELQPYPPFCNPAFTDGNSAYAIYHNAGGSENVIMSRQAGDDSMLGFYMGPPVCFARPAASEGNWQQGGLF